MGLATLINLGVFCVFTAAPLITESVLIVDATASWPSSEYFAPAVGFGLAGLDGPGNTRGSGG